MFPHPTKKDDDHVQFRSKRHDLQPLRGDVEKAVRSVDSGADVKIDLANLMVKVESAEPAASFADAIEEAGYTPQLRA